MRREKKEIWKSNMVSQYTSLCQSGLDSDTKKSIDKEMFYYNNHYMLWIVWIIIGIETFNIFNVIFLSKSGLSSANNRLYFFMYLIMLLSAIIILLSRNLLKNKKGILSRCYFAAALGWVCWHAILNLIDLRTSNNTIVFVTALFGITLLLRLKPWEAVCIIPGNYLLFCILAGSDAPGVYINTGIAMLVSLLVSFSRYRSTVEELGYRKKLMQQNERNVVKYNQYNLLWEKYETLKALMEEVCFEWDKEEDRITFSQSVQKQLGFHFVITNAKKCMQESGYIRIEDLQALQQWFKEDLGKDMIRELTIKDGFSNIIRCRIRGKVLTDANQLPTCMIGIIDNINNVF